MSTTIGFYLTLPPYRLKTTTFGYKELSGCRTNNSLAILVPPTWATYLVQAYGCCDVIWKGVWIHCMYVKGFDKHLSSICLSLLNLSSLSSTKSFNLIVCYICIYCLGMAWELGQGVHDPTCLIVIDGYHYE